MSINVQPEGNFFFTWYQKPSDTGTILNYRSCAPLQHKKRIKQRTIHRLFRANSNIVRTVRGDTKELLDAVNDLYPNLQFTLLNKDEKNSLPLLDMSIKVQPEGNFFCTWYQKPSVTGTILNYRSCAPLQHKKSITQRTMHRLFRATSDIVRTVRGDRKRAVRCGQ